MARGDLTMFEEFSLDIGKKVHDLSSDTIKLGIIDNTVAPTASVLTPSWADYSANEVSTAGNYTANGETLASVTYTEAGGVSTLDATNVTIAQDASGFTDAYWAIVYNDTATSDEAIAFIELDGPVSEVTGNVNINFNASGITTVTA